MKSYRTIKFKNLFKALPPDIQTTARKACKLWIRDPRHPSLHFKSIRGRTWSVRISLDYRALGVMRGENIYWHWIGTHDAYERLIK